MYRFKTRLCALVFLLSSSLALSATNTFSNLPPRAIFELTSGNGTYGQMDAMVPVWGNADQSLYGDLIGKYGDDQAWVASLGLGGRKIFNNVIWGAYLFNDYNRTPNRNYFFVASPGLEFMTTQWDTHLNGYFPVGSQQKKLGPTAIGSELGFSDTVSFRQHTQYDMLFNYTESIGPGAEIEVGRTASSLGNTRFFAGGYHFRPQNNGSINGAEIGFEMPFRYQWATLVVRDTYDNDQHNTFALTLRLSLGGLKKTTAPTLQSRMLDRIPRYLANLQTGDGIPSRQSWVNSGTQVAVLDNIWFFNPDAETLLFSSNIPDGTFEHPFIGLSQEKIDAIQTSASNANFYLRSGTYLNPQAGTGFTFANGQSVFGRNQHFTVPANGNNRPLINDTFILSGNNTVENVRINGGTVITLPVGPSNIGVFVPESASGTINLVNDTINSSVSNENNAVAISIRSNVIFNITNSTVTANTVNSPASTAQGITATLGAVNVNTSSILVTSSNNLDTFDTTAFGVAMGINNRNTINISQSTIAVEASGADLIASISNTSERNGKINIDQSTITTTGSNTAGIFSILNLNTGIINVNRSFISMIGNNQPANSTTIGIDNNESGQVTLTRSIIEGAANAGDLVGINNFDTTSIVNFQNSIIKLNNIGEATLTMIGNAGVLNDLGRNQCYENGTIVSC